MKRILYGLALGLAFTACKGDSDSQKGSSLADGPLYLVSTFISTPDGDVSAVFLPSELKTEALNLENAQKIPGGATTTFYNHNLFIGHNETFEIKRYDLTDQGLVENGTMSLADRGMTWLYEPIYVSEEKAYIFNDAQLQFIEWNPKSMTITRTHDLSALKKDGWAYEYRDDFYRASDGKIFFYFAYTNERTSFINEFTVGVFDTKTNSLKILTDPDCPTSAGFGGYIDEQGDFYAFADSFGLFTQLNTATPKKACVLRVKNGEDSFDPAYRYYPSDAIGGKAPWGYYYLGNGLAFTSVVDAASSTFGSVYELLFAPIHPGALIDIKNNTSIPIPDLPLSGVGFQPYSVDNTLLVSRTSGSADDNENVDDAQSIVYQITSENGQGKASPLFKLPGFVDKVERIR